MESSKKFWIYNRYDNPYKFIEASSCRGVSFTPGTAIIGTNSIRKVEGNPKARFGIKPTIPIDASQFSQFNVLVLMSSNRTYSSLEICFNDSLPQRGVTYRGSMSAPTELSCDLPSPKNLTDNFVIGELTSEGNTLMEIYEMWLT